jgi:hypothetical protein
MAHHGTGIAIRLVELTEVTTKTDRRAFGVSVILSTDALDGLSADIRLLVVIFGRRFMHEPQDLSEMNRP